MTLQLNYFEAQTNCHHDNAILAEPKSQVENNAINQHAPFEALWIGVNDMNNEGQFVYDSDLTPIVFANWDANEPNDQLGSEDAVHTIPNTTGKWNDNFVTSEFYSMCQKEPFCP